MSQSSDAPAATPGGGSPGRVPVPPTRRRGAGTAGDMLRSLLVIGALVAVVVLAVPRPQGRIEQPIDVTAATAQAVAGGLDVREPDVPDGWRPNAATFGPDPEEGLPTWSVGYLLPDDTFAGVRATRGATPAWLGGVTSSGRPAPEGARRDVAGATWESLVSERGASRRSLVLVEGQQTTVVTGTADDAQLDALAAAVLTP